MADPIDPSWTPEYLEAINEKLRDQNNIQKQKLDVLEKILLLQDQITLTATTNTNQIQAEIQALNVRASQGQTELERMQATLEIAEKEEEMARNFLVVNTKKFEDAKKTYDFVLQQYNTNKATAQELQKAKDEMEEQNATLEITKAILSDLIIANNENKRNQEELLRLARERYNVYQQEKYLVRDIALELQQQVGTTLGISSLIKNITMGMNPWLALTKEIASNSIKMLDTIIKADISYTATTGRIAERSFLFGAGMSRFGVGFKEMNESMIALYTSMSGFTDLLPDQQEKLAGTAARMKNLGVEVTTTGKNYDILTKTLRMSADGAIAAQDKIAKHAIAAGIAPKQMLQEFATNMPRLAAYGEQAVDVFIKMEKQAKSLGMSVQDLNGIVGQQFDTFDGAASAAGKLNAILGGNYLNSIEMMNATESERILIMKKAIDAAHLQADGMNKFQLIAFANAAGIKDLSAAKNLLNKSTSQLTMDMEKEAASQKELQKAQEVSADISKKMQIALQGVYGILQPLVWAITRTVSGIAALNDMTRGILIPLVAVSFGIYKFVTALKAAQMAWTALDLVTKRSVIGLTVMALAIAFSYLHDIFLVPNSPILFFALMELPPIILAIGKAADLAKYGILALGVAMALLGVGVFLAARGLAELVKAFSGLTGPQAITAFLTVTVVMIAFIAALAILAKVSTVAAIPILAVGAGILMIGGGIYLAATGVANLVKAVGELASKLTVGMIGTLYGFAGALGLIVGTLSGAAFGGLGMAIGALAVSGAILLISKALGTLNETKITAFQNMIKTFADTIKLSGIEAVSVQIANAINNISTAIDKIPESKSVNFTATMDSINRTFASIAQSDPAKIDSAKQFVDTATKYYTVQKDSKSADNDALVAALTKALTNVMTAATPGKEGKGGGGDVATVTLQIDGQQMGKALLPYIDSKLASKYKGSF